jgi:hypothetical protein
MQHVCYLLVEPYETSGAARPEGPVTEWVRRLRMWFLPSPERSARTAIVLDELVSLERGAGPAGRSP